MSPENGWLEDGSFPFSKMVPFQRTNSFIFVGYLVPKSQISMLLPISQAICAGLRHSKATGATGSAYKVETFNIGLPQNFNNIHQSHGYAKLEGVGLGWFGGDEVIVDPVIMWWWELVMMNLWTFPVTTLHVEFCTSSAVWIFSRFPKVMPWGTDLVPTPKIPPQKIWGCWGSSHVASSFQLPGSFQVEAQGEGHGDCSTIWTLEGNGRFGGVGFHPAGVASRTPSMGKITKNGMQYLMWMQKLHRTVCQLGVFVL